MSAGGHVTARDLSLLNCHSCGLLSRKPTAVGTAHCPRCDAVLHDRKPDSIARTWALVITASILYVPANVLPVTRISTLGNVQEDTIMSGVIYFLLSGSWHLALIIFVASVVVPLAKLAALVYLLISVQRGSTKRPRDRTRLYRITELIGRWSMVDVYVVTVLVALVQLGNLATIQAGWGAVAFGAVVVITMIAAMTFDPRLIWDRMEIHE